MAPDEFKFGITNRIIVDAKVERRVRGSFHDATGVCSRILRSNADFETFLAEFHGWSICVNMRVWPKPTVCCTKAVDRFDTKGIPKVARLVAADNVRS